MNKFRIITIIVLLLLGRGVSFASNICYTKADSLIFETYIKNFEEKKHRPISSLTIETAKYFLGKPYVAHTLEVNPKEQLVVNLREFDCTTFVESCMALTRTLKSETPSFQTFCNWLQKTRYRNGEIIDYSSRLHYISDWAFEHSDFLQDAGKHLGLEPMNKRIDFMSRNKHLYKHLKNDKTNQNNIKKTEDSLNKREGCYVILKDEISKYAESLTDGDIVVFATAIAGLDFTHIGFIYHENNILKFIHASSSAKKTVIEQKSLIDYCNSSKTCTGVTILKQND